MLGHIDGNVMRGEVQNDIMIIWVGKMIQLGIIIWVGKMVQLGIIIWV